MKRFIKLTVMEGKRAFKVLPLMLAEAVVMCGLLGILLILCQRLFFGDFMLQKMPIGIVIEEENSMTELALTYLEGMESTAAVCDFHRMTKEEGETALRRNEIAALMVLPKEMVMSILDGRNYPVQIYFPKDSSFGALLIQELTEAGAGMLSMAQAEVYAAYDMSMSFPNLAELSTLESDINLFNMRFAMARERLLNRKILQISDEIPLPLHYLASGITMFLMLWGIACSRFLKGDSQSFGRQLLRAGIKRWQWMAAKLAGVLIVLGIGAGCIFAVTAGSQSMLTGLGLEIGIEISVVPYMLAALVCIAAFLLFCYQAVPSRSSGMILVFTITIAIIFISGGLVPSVFLPQSMNRLAEWLPGHALIQITAAMIGTGTQITGLQHNFLLLAGWSCIFYLAACLINIRKGESDS